MISTITPSPYLAASDTLTVTGTTTAASDTVAVALTPVTVPATTVTATATVSPNKSWTATFTKTQVGQITDGTATVTATSTADGTAGTAATKTFVKDTTVPAVTAAVSPTVVGTTSAGVVSTVSGTVKVSSATGAAAEAGDTVLVSADDAGDAATAPVTKTLTTDSSGAFTGTINAATLDDGTITYTYVATDAAGNKSAAVTTTNTKDSVGPTTAPTVSVSPDPIANATKTQVSVSGSATGATVAISISDGANTPVTATATVSSGSYAKSAIDVSTLAEGTLTVVVTTSDTAGNPSPAASKTVLKDTVGPATTLEIPAYITSSNTNATPVSGVSEPGAVIAIKATDSATTAASVSSSVTVPSDGHWTRLLNTSGLAEGTITFVATGTDAAGNAGAAVTKTSTKDVTAPAAPATVKGAPTPYSTGTFTVSGTTSFADRAAVLTVDVTITDVLGHSITSTGQPVTAATGLATAGTFSVPFGVNQMKTLAEGALTISAVFRDAAGNGSTATTAAAENGLLTLVSTNPVKDSTVKPPATVSATYNQNLSSTGTGTTSTITVKDAANATVPGATSIVGTTITFTPTTALPAGVYSVSVTAYDKLYTTESSTDTFSFTADPTAAPAPPVIKVFTTPITTANQTTVTVSGTADEATSPVTVTIGSLPAKTVAAGSDKTWSTTFDVTTLADGTLTATATQSDGTKTSAAATRTSTKDTTAPVKTSSSPAAGATVSSLSSVSITFDQDLATTGTISIPGVTGTSAVDARTVTFTASAPFADGTYTATAQVTDLVGNAATATTTFTVDSTPAPTASSISLGALPSVVVYGQTITLRGRVTQSTPATYGKVTLRAVTDAGQVVSLGEVSVASDGTWTKSLKPSVNAIYQAGYLGDSANTVSVSKRYRTNVAPKVTASSVRGSHALAAVINGTVTPSTTATVVTIYKVSKNGAKVKAGTAKVGSNRKFTFKVTLPKGTTKLLAVVAKSSTNAGGSVAFTATRT